MDNLQQLAADPRVTVRRAGPPDPQGTCVLYWMQRSQRGTGNPALDVAVRTANLLKKPAVVFFALKASRGANLRHYAFLAQGIPDIAEALEGRGIGFLLRRSPQHSLQRVCEDLHPALVVGDENPLRGPESRRQQASRHLRVPFWTVDADVIVPSKLLEKAQYAARIIRPRLNKLLADFLVPGKDHKARYMWKKPTGLVSLNPHSELLQGWPVDRSVQAVSRLRGGSRQADRLLQDFVRCKLASYPKLRNHPESDGTSQLSPYLHFGHLSPVRVAIAVEQADAPRAAKIAFLDQLITWRELSVNFVRFNPNYDGFESAEPWAHRTLAEHSRDRGLFIYTARQLENAETTIRCGTPPSGKW